MQFFMSCPTTGTGNEDQTHGTPAPLTSQHGRIPQEYGVSHEQEGQNVPKEGVTVKRKADLSSGPTQLSSGQRPLKSWWEGVGHTVAIGPYAQPRERKLEGQCWRQSSRPCLRECPAL